MGTGELTTGSHTGTGSLGAAKGRGLRDRRGVGGERAGGLPTALPGQPAKAPAADQFLERDVGVSEVGKELAASSHDVTGPAPAWPGPGLAAASPGEGRPGLLRAAGRGAGTRGPVPERPWAPQPLQARVPTLGHQPGGPRSRTGLGWAWPRWPRGFLNPEGTLRRRRSSPRLLRTRPTPPPAARVRGGACALGLAAPSRASRGGPPPPVGSLWIRETTFLLLFWDFQFRPQTLFFLEPLSEA